MDRVVLNAGGRGTEQLLKHGQQSTRERRGAAPLPCGIRGAGGWVGARSVPPLLSPGSAALGHARSPRRRHARPREGLQPPGFVAKLAAAVSSTRREPRREPGTLLPSSPLSPEEFIA